MFKNNPSSYFCLFVAFCRMEFYFYLEKWRSGQNLTNRTVCYGLAVTHVAKQAKTANVDTLIKQYLGL